MKTMFDNMVSLIIMMILVFVFTGFISIETQVINARNTHSRVVELYQNSFHNLSATDFNKEIKNGHIEINPSDLDEYEVVYTYDVSIPFLNITDTQRIVGYSK